MVAVAVMVVVVVVLVLVVVLVVLVVVVVFVSTVVCEIDICAEGVAQQVIWQSIVLRARVVEV